MIIGTRILYIIFNAAIYIGVTDRITYIVAQKTAHVGQALFPLLSGSNPGKLQEAAAEEIVDMMLMHVRAYIAVIPVAEDGQVVKEHIRPLKTQLIKPSVLGNDKLQIVLGHIIVCFRA